jgi:hypothetical protein
MKSKKNQFQSVLKIVLMIFIFLNSMHFFGQDTMENAKVLLSFSEENDSKIITAVATDQEGQAIEDLELYFYVKRTFSLLPIGDIFNSTDENGIVEIEFPNDLPGDTEGNVDIVVKIIEAELYNDLTLETTKKWGVPVALFDQQDEKRSLWAAAANAPITLVISVSFLIIVVWYIIWYIIFKLYKISKIKRLNS